MNNISALLCAILALNVSTSFAVDQEIRTWTSKSGATVDAAFVAAQGSNIALKKSDGSMIQIPQSGLSAADNTYLKRLLFKPKTVTVLLKPVQWKDDLTYIEIPPEENEQRGPLENRRRDPRDPSQRLIQRTVEPTTKPKRQEPRQGDTLIYKIQSIDDGTWHDDSAWEVLSAEETKELTGTGKFNGAEKLTTENRFIIVAYKLTNAGNTDRYVTVPVIFDAKDRRFTHIANSGDFILNQYADPYLDGKIAPSFTRSYCVIYEIPIDATGLKLGIETLEKRSLQGERIRVGENCFILDVQNRI